MSSIHVARQGFVTKSALPSVSRERGTTTVADNRTVLLLNGNGTNGAQNNTFLDSSTNNFSITRNGNATQGSFSPFTLADGQWSNFFDGTGNNLSFPSGAAFQFGTGDFTIESWVYLNSAPQFQYIIDARNSGQQTNWAFAFGLGTAGRLGFFNGTTTLEEASVSVTANTWTHCAVVRSGTTLSIFVNGTRVATTTNSTNFNVSPTISYIGSRFSSDSYRSAYLSNVRTVKGTAVYDPTLTTLTVPTTPLTAISGTSLLTCQSNRFRDNSSNNFAITRNGDVRVTPWSPFAPTSAYDPATNGGSGYFDGTGDYLALTPNSSMTLDGDFTIETWVYFTALDTAERIPVNCWNFGSGWLISTQSGAWNFKSSSFTLTYSAVAPVAGTWYHIAVTRSGSSTNNVTMFLNGAQVAQGTYTGTMTPASSSTGCVIGGGAGGTGQLITGYVSNLRIVKGTAVYTTNFTPPTAPVTNITNTSLLLNFTNAGIFDTAGDNVIETVGNAQISTAIKRYGSGSLKFDGSGDYLTIGSYNPDSFTFGTGNFTIEMWVYFNDVTNPQNIYESRASTEGNRPTIYVQSGIIRFYSSSDLITSPTVSTGRWYHLAVAKSSGSTRMFLDGVQVGSTYSDSINYGIGANRPLIGTYSPTSGFFNGYIDDLRITKGFARYTANFTPPSSELVIVGTVPNIVNNSTYGVYQLA